MAWHHQVKEHCVRIAGTSAEVCLEPIRARYHKHYYKRRHHLVIDLFLTGVVVILGVLIAYLWIAPVFFRPLINVTVATEPAILKSLQKTTFHFKYTNTSRDALEDVELILLPPANVVFDKTEFKIGSLRAGDSGEMAATGQVIGRLISGNMPAVEVPLRSSYMRQGKSRQELSNVFLQPVESVLSMTAPSYEEVAVGVPTTWTVTVKNNSSEDQQITGEWQLPSPIKVLGSAKISGTIEAGTAKDFRLNGTVTDAPADTRLVLRPEVGVAIGEDFFPQVALDVGVRPIVSHVNVDLSLADQVSFVRPGETVKFKIHYRNGESFDIDHETISTDLPQEYFVPGSLDSDNAYAEKDDQLSWDQEKVPALALLKPGDEGDVLFTAKLKRPITPTNREGVSTLPAAVVLKYYGSNFKGGLQVRGVLSPTPLETVVTIDAAARYFAFGGEQLGRGPLPPRVGKETRYWIFLKLTNTTNLIQDGLMSLRLAPGVLWTGQVSAKDSLSYDAATSAVLWRLGTLGSWTGYGTPAVEAAFEVTFNPAASQAGRVAPLVLDPFFTGHDSETGQTVKVLVQPLTTNLTSDAIAAGRGLVKP